MLKSKLFCCLWYREILRKFKNYQDFFFFFFNESILQTTGIHTLQLQGTTSIGVPNNNLFIEFWLSLFASFCNTSNHDIVQRGTPFVPRAAILLQNSNVQFSHSLNKANLSTTLRSCFAPTDSSSIDAFTSILVYSPPCFCEVF